MDRRAAGSKAGIRHKRHINQRRKMMRSATKHRPVIFLYLILVPAMALIAVAPSFAADGFTVSIGSSSWSADEASSHDISRSALESGQNNFVVSSSEGDSYQIHLSKKQIDDILAGSTVIVATEKGNQKVKIAPKQKKAVSSGW
ncbi:MAG: hypothetical protein P8010_14830 [Desulfosarcinaceae bacterium]